MLPFVQANTFSCSIEAAALPVDQGGRIFSPMPVPALTTSRRAAAVAKLPWVDVYSDFTAERICEAVAEGRTLARIALEEPWGPSTSQVYERMLLHPEFREAYVEARLTKADVMAEEVVELADAAKDLEHLPYQIQNRQWLASKINPAEYGDRRLVEQNINARVQTVSKIDVSDLTLEEIDIAKRALKKAITAVADDANDD